MSEATLDRAALDRLVSLGGMPLLRDMVRLFHDTAPEKIAAARQAQAAGDLSGVEKAVHPLKSSAAYVGAVRMSRLANEAQNDARDGRWQRIEELLTAIEEEFAKAGPEMQAVLTQAGT